MIRQSHLIAVVGAYLIGCAVLVMAGCAGVRSEASQKEEQGHAEATASEEARCSQTRTFKVPLFGVYTTNDVPGCPEGGLLSGTDGRDKLDGKKGDDEVRGLGGVDDIAGGDGNDVIYGGPGDDYGLYGERGDDVIYGGDGNDENLHGDEGEDVLYGGKDDDGLDGGDPQRGGVSTPVRDELYCGPGKDQYAADRLDYVDSSCEEKVKGFAAGGIA